MTTLHIDDEGAVRVLRLDRPDALNAFDVALYQALTAALRDAKADDAVHVVVLTGTGRSFTTGTDIKEMASLAAGTGPEGAERGFPDLMDAVTTFDKPLVAAVNGMGIGLGMTILSFCDLVFMAESARLKAPFAAMGVPPEAASSLLLPLRMGWQRAAQVLLTADWIDARHAVASGLATEVCPDDELLATALAAAQRIAAHDVNATRTIKGLMLAAERDAVAAARAREDDAFAALFRPSAGAEPWQPT